MPNDEAKVSQQSGVGLITSERQRQIESEGWNWSHDDDHTKGEIVRAAASYVLYVCGPYLPGVPRNDSFLMAWARAGLWPWDPACFKPTHDPIRNLAKAGALIAAEIDRLLRAKENEEPDDHPEA